MNTEKVKSTHAHVSICVCCEHAGDKGKCIWKQWVFFSTALQIIIIFLMVFLLMWLEWFVSEPQILIFLLFS